MRWFDFVRFTDNQQRFWASPAMGTFPAGFTACLADLSQACPDAVGLLADTQPPETSVLMFGGAVGCEWVVISTLGICAHLGDPPGPADVARKLLCNFIEFALPSH